MLEPETSAPLRALRAMEGLESVKASVDGLLKLAESNARREELEMAPAEVSLNRVFLGNPGTGKTTVAKIYGQILKELGLLSNGDVVLTTPADFLGSALGQSEEKTNALLDKAEGCVLVIDEAYGLDPNGAGGGTGAGGIAGGDPFKTAVINTLVSRVQGNAGSDQVREGEGARGVVGGSEGRGTIRASPPPPVRAHAGLQERHGANDPAWQPGARAALPAGERLRI